MKFVLTVQYKDKEKHPGTWEEPYDDPKIKTEEEVKEWAKKTVDWYNETLRPNELARELVGVNITSEVSEEHNWYKTSMMSQSGDSGVYDVMRCESCRITGKRYGLSGNSIARDKPFEAEKFSSCTETKDYLMRRRLQNELGLRRMPTKKQAKDILEQRVSK